jgi:hypothetical protein
MILHQAVLAVSHSDFNIMLILNLDQRSSLKLERLSLTQGPDAAMHWHDANRAFTYDRPGRSPGQIGRFTFTSSHVSPVTSAVCLTLKASLRQASPNRCLLLSICTAQLAGVAAGIAAGRKQIWSITRPHAASFLPAPLSLPSLSP